MAGSCLALSADVQGPRQRQSPRPDGDDGRDAPALSASARRQLPGRRPDRRALRLEDDYRPVSRPAHAPQPVELPVVGWDGAAGVPGVDGRPEDRYGVGCVRGLLAQG